MLSIIFSHSGKTVLYQSDCGEKDCGDCGDATTGSRLVLEFRFYVF